MQEHIALKGIFAVRIASRMRARIAVALAPDVVSDAIP
jgi:hypothetical protein